MEGTSIRLMEELLTCGTNISLWHYDTDGHLLETNAQFLVLDKILGFIGNLDYLLAYAEKHKNPLILGSDMGLMWCAVLERDRQGLQGIYLMGPVYHAEISGSFLEESAARYQVDPAFRRQYVQIMKGIPVVPAMMLQQYGLMLHYCVNGEKLNRSDIYFQPRSKVLTPLSAELEEAPRDWGHTYQAEQALLRQVREGDIHYRDTFSQAQHLFGALGPGGQESLQRSVLRATGFATLCIREAILAGISVDTAYAVGEGYIESMAQAVTSSELTALTLSLFEDFIFRVHKHRTNPVVSSQIRSCRDYIELHAEQELKLSVLARHVGYSEYYLSRKFRQEMGVSIGTYIKYVRVERAKLMLVTTALPISQIADTLHFASSSHFSDTFREIVGKPPQQYRRENQKY